MLWQMPHVSTWDSHNSHPQSEHCLLEVLRHARPTASAEFLTSTTLQFIFSHAFSAQNAAPDVTHAFPTERVLLY